MVSLSNHALFAPYDARLNYQSEYFDPSIAVRALFALPAPPFSWSYHSEYFVPSRAVPSAPLLTS